ncbi:hypothetical protein [Neorhizobium galegae]|uniref:hypothetical protein n=1 Tax=Neorhizobium galegae TaxID=399 RepID=UPI002107E5F5|nr:hypothetical protein [Neorhizobium galegae]MCQ1839084.1 hypothetical protein [Neorhizobium galegae]
MRQEDLEVIFRAAKVTGSTVRIHPRTFEITILPFVPSHAHDLPAVGLIAEPDKNFVRDSDKLSEQQANGRAFDQPSKAESPLQAWYDEIGFDPNTMGEAEMLELMDKADEQWRRELPKTPMNKLEKSALRQLLQYGVGVPVDWRDIKRCGYATEQRLNARGFIDLCMSKKHPEQIAAYALTTSGRDAAIRLDSNN